LKIINHLLFNIFIHNQFFTNLAKIIIKSILLLENCGINVVGITSDGASTNRSMWNMLGVSAKNESFKNYFANPFDSERSVFVFSDAPHLIKTIRNRLYTKKDIKSN